HARNGRADQGRQRRRGRPDRPRRHPARRRRPLPVRPADHRHQPETPRVTPRDDVYTPRDIGGDIMKSVCTLLLGLAFAASAVAQDQDKDALKKELLKEVEKRLRTEDERLLKDIEKLI